MFYVTTFWAYWLAGWVRFIVLSEDVGAWRRPVGGSVLFSENRGQFPLPALPRYITRVLQSLSDILIFWSLRSDASCAFAVFQWCHSADLICSCFSSCPFFHSSFAFMSSRHDGLKVCPWTSPWRSSVSTSTSAGSSLRTPSRNSPRSRFTSEGVRFVCPTTRAYAPHVCTAACYRKCTTHAQQMAAAFAVQIRAELPVPRQPARVRYSSSLKIVCATAAVRWMLKTAVHF